MTSYVVRVREGFYTRTNGVPTWTFAKSEAKLFRTKPLAESVAKLLRARGWGDASVERSTFTRPPQTYLPFFHPLD